jgi:hypothetical protein
MKSAIDVEIARLFYACNLPFSLVEHPQFIKVVQLLRPGYKPPSRKQIGGTLLDTVHDQVTEDMKAILNGKTATLVEDGLSNVHNEPIIASCLQVEGKSFFLHSYDTGSMTKSAENCKVKCQETIKHAKQKYNCTVRTIVTDNAKNMEKMRDNLKAEDNDLVVYGCSAHWLNLLGQDITPDSLIKHIVEIQKYSRNHHKPLSWLSDCPGSMKPQLPCDTRWKSQLMCIDSFIHNRPHFMKIVQDHEGELESAIIRKIMDYNLFKNARDLAEQLRPISHAIDICQGDSATLADACNVWINLKNNTLLEPHKKHVSARFHKAVLPEHLVAYTLHPKYQGELLTPDQLEIVNKWVISKDPNFIATLISYQAKSMPFPVSYFSDAAVQVPPLTWWKGLKPLGVSADFIDMALQLMDAPASSASIERIFSNFSYIHTNIRNRLGVEKASKLVFCYRMLGGLSD